MTITYSPAPVELSSYTHVLITKSPMGGFVVTLYRGVTRYGGTDRYTQGATVLSGKNVWAITDDVEEAMEAAFSTGLVVV